VAGAGNRREVAAMFQPLGQWIVASLPLLLAVFTAFARRWF